VADVTKLTKRERKLLTEKRERPDDCFCIEDGVIESHATSKAVRTFTGYHKLDLYRENPFRISVFRCATCGKEYVEEIWIA